MSNYVVKKDLMYLSGEDFYLFSYSILIVLDSLSCRNGRFFKDYRKLPFIIEFALDDRLIRIVEHSLDSDLAELNPVDKEILVNSYSSGMMRRSEVLKILFTLENKGFVDLTKGTIDSVLDVSLNKNKVPESFFDKKQFKNEYQNVARLQKSVTRLSVLKLDTFFQKIYMDRGITTWAL